MVLDLKLKEKIGLSGDNLFFYHLSIHLPPPKKSKAVGPLLVLLLAISVFLLSLTKLPLHYSTEHIILHSVADNYYLTITHHFLRYIFMHSLLYVSCGRGLFTLA